MCASTPEIPCRVGTFTKLSNDATIQLSNMKGRLNDAEDRSRRRNLLFYEILKKQEGTGAQSEGLGVEIFKNKVKITLGPNDIEIALIIGK